MSNLGQAIKDRLEKAYRCGVGVSIYRNHYRISFSHLPHALEGLEGTAIHVAVAQNLAGLPLASDGDEVIISVSVRQMP